jgi:DHA2 family multidrug resistance protein
MLCLLPPTRLALGHFAPARVADASGLFNLMRNLGGAIGIALIDTVIYGRGPGHVRQLADRLMAGDVATAQSIGLPDGVVTGIPIANADPSMLALVQPLLEKAGLVVAINEAWAMLAAFMALSVIGVFLIRPQPRAG